MTERIYKVCMPLRIVWGKGKTTKFTFNLNPYRNAHHQVLSRAKLEYTKVAHEMIKAMNIPPMSKIMVLYRYFPRTIMRTDLGNVGSIHDKFFLDALVTAGIIPDDDYHHVVKTVFEFGEVDRLCPRMEIFIRDLSNSPNNQVKQKSKAEVKIMEQKVVIENVTHIEIEGSKTVIHVEKGTSITLLLAGVESAVDTVETETKPAKKVAKAKVEKKVDPKKTKEEKEPEVEVEPEPPFDTDETSPEPEKQKEEPVLTEEGDDEEGFTEFEEDETSINEVFAQASKESNNAPIDAQEPKQVAKKDVFATSTKPKEEEGSKKKNPFNF